MRVTAQESEPRADAAEREAEGEAAASNDEAEAEAAAEAAARIDVRMIDFAHVFETSDALPSHQHHHTASNGHPPTTGIAAGDAAPCPPSSSRLTASNQASHPHPRHPTFSESGPGRDLSGPAPQRGLRQPRDKAAGGGEAASAVHVARTAPRYVATLWRRRLAAAVGSVLFAWLSGIVACFCRSRPRPPSAPPYPAMQHAGPVGGRRSA